ncbi:SurA N-terminal domain-containing protein [Schnuerera sp. xch1]|uniref:SurA N-terminal domain-containing protein n=1 Tax=Schnuerera sp. xch1 TaxID=2874283 RepID=UPI001CC01320|nr:SurA N-terminal domain-containing protein [Schnuerera sp. xch1]MBZ2174593.1 SurA N-terminal domain-containing protein [Schnuerera sp. xch1]
MKPNANYFIILLLVSIISSTIVGCSNNNRVKEEVVAEVNGYEITQQEFDEDFEMIKNNYISQYGEDVMNQESKDNGTFEDVLREWLLRELIYEKLKSEELKKLGIKITEEEQQKYLQNMNANNESLKRIANRELIHEKHREHFFNELELSEKEIKKYFDEHKDSLIKVRASHIIVETEEDGNEVLRRLQEGEDFISLAATESIYPQAAIKGGDYFVKGGTQYKEIEDVALDLGIGEISGLIKTDLGYHIVLVEDRMDTFDDLKEEAREALKNQRYSEELDKLINEADVKIYKDSFTKGDEEVEGKLKESIENENN